MDTQSVETLLEPTLPGAYYYNPELYAQEQEAVFSRSWVCVGRADRIPTPGEYFTVPLGRENVIVLRGRDGEVRGFLNVCRHRGARLCTAEQGKVAGSIQCKYHAWTYGLDGRLLGAPNIYSLDSFDRDKFGLVPVALEVWQGLVWVNLAEKPTPLSQQLNPLIVGRFGGPERFERYGLGRLGVGRSIQYTVKANWKLVVENFMECYHCAPMHPELCRLVPAFRSGESYQRRVGEGSYLAESVEAFTLSGQGWSERLPGLLDEDDRQYFGLVLYPNVLMSLLPDHIILHTAYPQGPDQTLVTCDWLFDPDALNQPDFDPTEIVEVFDLVNRQDWEVCELTQQGMSSRAYREGGVYVPTEHHIRRFNDFVLTQLTRVNSCPI